MYGLFCLILKTTQQIKWCYYSHFTKKIKNTEMQRSDFTLYPLSRIHFASSLIGLNGRQRCYSPSSVPPYLISSWYVVPAPAHWASYHGGCKNLAAHCIFLAAGYSSQLLACFCISYKISEEAHLPLQKAASCRFQRETGKKGRESSLLFMEWGSPWWVSLRVRSAHNWVAPVLQDWLPFWWVRMGRGG